MKNTIWLRDESRITERRTPLLPEGAKQLIAAGYSVVVEKSAKRIVADKEYKKAGCEIEESGSWVRAPKEAVILGLKELPATPDTLRNTHIYFAHAYKQQSGWQELLSRFVRGGSALLDIEYMTLENGRRVVAFGFWAGYMGAALALIHWHDKQASGQKHLQTPLIPFDNADLLDEKIAEANNTGKIPKVLIIGALGRSGKGAHEILSRHGAQITYWDQEETNPIDRPALLDHDILINCAFITGDIPPFIRTKDLTDDIRLSVIADVSCDPFSSFNPIPLYHDVTTWDDPYITVGEKGKLDIIAIDNLPSLLPREASSEFSGLMLPHLMTLENKDHDPVWSAAHDSFNQAVSQIKKNDE